jgi:hypothetical protein
MSEEKFVVICHSQRDENLTLMLADSNLVPQFWTRRPSEALVYTDIDLAITRRMKLKFNNPRVVTLDEATKMIADEYHRYNRVKAHKP